MSKLEDLKLFHIVLFFPPSGMIFEVISMRSLGDLIWFGGAIDLLRRANQFPSIFSLPGGPGKILFVKRSSTLDLLESLLCGVYHFW